MRVAVLASGSGTILDAILSEGIPVELVVVDRPCLATDVATRHQVTAELVLRQSYDQSFDRDAYTADLVDLLEKHDIELVVMAGYGTILGSQLFEAYAGRILNTHPALLPSFKGWHAVRDALAADETERVEPAAATVTEPGGSVKVEFSSRTCGASLAAMVTEPGGSVKEVVLRDP